MVEDIINSTLQSVFNLLGSIKKTIIDLLPGSENIILLVIAVGLTYWLSKSEIYKKGGINFMLIIGLTLFLLLKLI